MVVNNGKYCCRHLQHANSNCLTEPVCLWVTCSCSLASTIFNSAIVTKSQIVLRGHLASWRALAILHCSAIRMPNTLVYRSWMLSRLWVLMQWVVWCPRSSSSASALFTRKLRISSSTAGTRFLASTREFLNSSMTFSLVWRGQLLPGHRCSTLRFLDFFLQYLLPIPHAVFGVPEKPFQLVHGVAQAYNTASPSLALACCSVMVCCGISEWSVSFAEQAEIGNCTFFCPHCSCCKELNSAV